MTTQNSEQSTPEERHPRALGRYVDLRVLYDFTTQRAHDAIAKEYSSDAATWCVKVTGDRT